jgi:hypothetical protein
MNEMPESLLAVDEPAPVTVHNENGRSPFLIVADHAGNSMPRALRQLGVPEVESKRHIAWDIGIAGPLPRGRGRARRHPPAAELFAPCHRLQPQAGLGDVDPGNQRTHADARKYGLE